MAHSFGVVEDKLREAEFFLEHLRQSSCHSFDAKFFFSAFVQAARSVTLAMQASLDGVAGFDAWYEGIRARLKTDPLAPYFVEIRNGVVHTGINPLNAVTAEHLREHLVRQLHHRDRAHVLVLPSAGCDDTVLVDAFRACQAYFGSLVSVVYDCYWCFRSVVDPRWHFTEKNHAAMGRSFEDALLEMGFPASWAACAPSACEAWRILRKQQPECQVNDLFEKYLGKRIADPDEVDLEEESQ